MELAHGEIKTCKEELKAARQVRQHRQEYDALAGAVLQHPDRQQTEKYVLFCLIPCASGKCTMTVCSQRRFITKLIIVFLPKFDFTVSENRVRTDVKFVSCNYFGLKSS